jgi:RNA polymerase sigma-70 factor (ECF subfamily)
MAYGLLLSVIVTRDNRLHFERTARELKGELYRAATRMAGRGGADDLVQETFLRALSSWHQLLPGASPRPWMHAILRNAFISQRRRAWRECHFEELPAQVDDRLIDRALVLDLRRALSRLPAPQKEALLLVDGEGIGYRELAARWGTPLGTVMSRVHRARARIAAMLK